GRAPQVQLRIQLPPKALDVEQRLLQQHQLRLDFDLEAPRGLKQTHQHHAQRDLPERTVEVWLADGADRRLQFIHACLGWHPAAFDVQLGHPLVVAPEEGREVLRQVFLVVLGEGANDAEVQGNVTPEGGRIRAHLVVAGELARMEKPTRNTWVEKIVTHTRASFGVSTPRRRSSSIRLMGTPCMRSMTMTSVRLQPQIISGMSTRSSPARLRRSW